MRASVVVVAVLLAAQVAQADTPPSPSPPASPSEPLVESYRSTTIMMDVTAAGLVALGVGGKVGVLALMGVPLYLVGPPLMHLSHSRPRTALASVSLRVGLPLLGLVVGDSLPDHCDEGDCIDSPPMKIVVGMGVGVVAASVIDAVFLAKGDEAPAKTQTSWRPIARPTRGGLALGIAGEF